MGLLDALRKRGPNYLTGPNYQAMADNAPVGAVGAPGGLLAPPAAKAPGNPLRGLLGATSVVPGLGDATGLMADALMYYEDPQSRTAGNFAMSALGALPFIPSLATVFHGSPYKFDAFDLAKLGTGEGAQMYGHGLYFADAPEVAKSYVPRDIGVEEKLMRLYKQAETAQDYDSMTVLEDALLHKTPTELKELYPEASRLIDRIAKIESKASGSLYTVDLPDEAIAKMLDWDQGGEQIYLEAVRKYGSPEAASAALKAQGIPGIRYLDGGSRGAGHGTSNYVVFDDRLPKILKRE